MFFKLLDKFSRFCEVGESVLPDVVSDAINLLVTVVAMVAITVTTIPVAVLGAGVLAYRRYIK